MCSLVAHDKIQPNYEDDESSIGDRSIPKCATTKALKLLGATLNFIGIWLKLFLDNYDTRCDTYVNAIKEMFKQRSLSISQPQPKYWLVSPPYIIVTLFHASLGLNCVEWVLSAW